MSKTSGRWTKKQARSSSLSQASRTKRGGETYKVTKNPPPEAPAPALKPRSSNK